MIDDGMVSMSAGVNRFWDLFFPKMGDDKQVWLKVAELSPLLLVERKLVVKSEEFVQFPKYWLTSKKKSFWYYFVDNWTDWCCKIARCNIFIRGLWYSTCAKRINIVQYRVGIQNITDCWQIAYYGWSLSKIIGMKWLEQIWTWLVFRWRQLGHEFCCLGQGEIGSHTGWRRQHICTRRLLFILMLSFKIFNHWHWRTKSFQNGWHFWRYSFCFINNTTENRIVKILNFQKKKSSVM